MLIDNVPATAPLFKKAPKDDLQAIIKHLQDASHHYADDSGREWGMARKHIADAAIIANRHKLQFQAVQAIHSEAQPLLSLEQFIDAVLKDARSQDVKATQ